MDLPTLPYQSWTETRITLHLVLQIIGKARLGLTTRKNHWWYITLYVSSRGFSTFTIPIEDGNASLEIELDIPKRTVVITHSSKGNTHIELKTGQSVAQFYRDFMSAMSRMELSPQFVHKPFDMGIDKPFDQLEEYDCFDWGPIQEFWRLMQWNNSIFKEFSGRFYGKTCPVQLYWHHMDLAVTRFSGKKLEPMDKSARISDRDAYSHEQISFGFWIGDDTVPEPAYYSYTYPSPDKIEDQPLSPDDARWVDSNGSPMAFLRYADVKSSGDPRQAVLNFLESAYKAGATLAGWKIKNLTAPPLNEV